MDPNPARNRKLAPVAPPAEEAPQKAPESAPEAPAKQAAPSPYSFSPIVGIASSGYVATMTTNNVLANWYPPTVPKTTIEYIAASDNRREPGYVKVSAYAAINGQLYSHNMNMDRFLWDSLTPEIRESQIRKVRTELAMKIAEHLVEAFVDGQPYKFAAK